MAGDLGEVLLANGGEADRAVAAREQPHLQMRFQGLDLVAYCRRSDAEFLGGTRNARQPARGLEGPQGIQWGRRVHVGKRNLCFRKNKRFIGEFSVERRDLAS
jgi:hypothetical protein